MYIYVLIMIDTNYMIVKFKGKFIHVLAFQNLLPENNLINSQNNSK